MKTTNVELGDLTGEVDDSDIKEKLRPTQHWLV